MEVEPDGTLVVGDFEKVIESGETCSIAGDYVTCTCDEEDSEEECCDCIDQSAPVCEGVKCKEAKKRNPSFGSISNISGMSGLLSPGLMSPMSLGIGSPILKKKKPPSFAKKRTSSPCCPGCMHPKGGPVCTTCGSNVDGRQSGDSFGGKSGWGSPSGSGRGSPVGSGRGSPKGSPRQSPKVSPRGSASNIAAHREPPDILADELDKAGVPVTYRVDTGRLSRIPTKGISAPISGATSRASARTAIKKTAGPIAEETARKSYISHIGTPHRAIVDTKSKMQALDATALDAGATIAPARTVRKSHKKGYGRYNLESVSSDVGLKRNLPKSGNKKKKQRTLKSKLESPRNVKRISEGKCLVDNCAISVVEREDTDEVVYEDSERSILNTGHSITPGMSSKFGSASYAGYGFLASSGMSGPRVTGLEGSKSAHQVQDAHDIMFVSRAGRHQDYATTIPGHAASGGSAVDTVDDTKLLLDGFSNFR